jgi:hypothetical protein
MPRFSIPAVLALTAAVSAAPAMAAPQFAGTNTELGSGGDSAVDCSDQQYRYMPYCEITTGRQTSSGPAVTGPKRTNLLDCPSDDLVAAGTDRNGNRLYRCETGKAGSPAATFTPGY